VWAALNLGETFWYRGDKDDARERFEQAYDVAQRLDNYVQMTYTGAMLGTCRFLSGQWDHARREFRQALACVPRARASMGTWVTLIGFAELCTGEGAWEEAEQYLQDGLSLTAEVDDRQREIHLRQALAERELLRGDANQALRWLEPLRDLSPIEPEYCRAPAALGSALLATGAVAEAATEAAQGLALTRSRGFRLFLPEWLELSGRVAAARGKWEEAARQLEEGIAEARSMGMAYDEGRIFYRLGVLHAQRGERGEARTQLEAGLAIFQRLGAKPYQERTEHALAAL
jgi:tetratricopeptide (TPR) repeat protein